jgi:prevent-host-death family protein
MPSEVGAYEAKTHLPALLERVAQGEEITITKHGRPIARLVPVAYTSSERRREVIERLKEFRKGRTLDVPIKQLIEEGRM